MGRKKKTSAKKKTGTPTAATSSSRVALSTKELMTSLENLSFTTDPSAAKDGTILVEDYHAHLSQDCPLCQGPVPPFWELIDVKSDDSKLRYWYQCCGNFCCMPCRRDLEEMVKTGAEKKAMRVVKKAEKQAQENEDGTWTVATMSGDMHDYVSDRKRQKYCLCPFCETPVIDIKGFYTKEYKMAIQEAALKKHLAYGQFGLGMLHLGGEHSNRSNNSLLVEGAGKRDPKLGVELLHKAAKQGHPIALYQLAVLYKHGRNGLPENHTLYNHLLDKAAHQGHALAALLLYGSHNREGSFSKALFYAKLGSKFGDTNCSFAAADLLENRDGKYGTMKDMKKAFEYYKIGAGQGGKHSQFHAAIMIHDYRNMGSKDDEIMYLEMAAKQGHKDAQHHLGLRLVDHDGPNWMTGPRFVEGAHWLRRARDNGSNASVLTLKSLEEETKCICFHCRAKARTEKRFSLCSKCKVVYYCSGSCQKAAWPSHKPFCKKCPTTAKQNKN